ncbi:MAG TPA: hypothetical protein DCQ06_01600 [Myxococcales bacterium]|nr:hypothetical protein [Myxococcales bacterium]HAN30268.1 hypothetical protein [Myxococcales bacterium]
MRFQLLLLMLAWLVGVSPAFASSDWTTKLSWKGQLRGVGSQLSAVDVGRVLASDPDQLPSYSELDLRLRLGGDVSFVRPSGVVRSISYRLQGDLYNGVPLRRGASDLMRYDDLYQLDGRSLDAFMVRQLQVQVDGVYGRVSVGRMMSTWGLGLIAQSGQLDPYQFGFKRQGVVVDRLQLITAPFQSWSQAGPSGLPLYIAVAADRVVFDDLADARKGDEAFNLVGAVLYQGQALQAGVYAVMRRQRDEAESTIDGQVADLFVSWRHLFGSWRLRLATEWLLLQGNTSYFRSTSQRDLLKIFQVGGVFRAQLDGPMFGLRAEGGFASGDDQPFDDTMSAFAFSRDYRVGLILFHEGMRRTSTLASANLADPRYVGETPAGFERAGTNGSVSSAMYGALTLAAYPIDNLRVLVGGLVAESPLPLVDAYQSGIRGGEAIGPRAGLAATGLGWEIDVAVRWRQPITETLAALIRFDWGRWQPGDAFDDADGVSAQPVQMWMAQLTLAGDW